MGTIWTPGGERPVGEGGAGDEPAGAEHEAPSEEELAAAREKLRQVRDELAQTPVRDIVANHTIGLWQLAVLHLGLDQEEGTDAHPPDLAEAKLAIDAMASLVEGVTDRLGDHAAPLQTALADLRLAYVRVSRDAGEPGEA